MEETISRRMVGAAIEVHRHLGPGLLGSAYQVCLAHELAIQDIAFEQQADLPVHYKGADLDCGYRMDLLVEQALVIEVKAVAHILPLHQVQLPTYLKLGGFQVGLLPKDGIVRAIY